MMRRKHATAAALAAASILVAGCAPSGTDNASPSSTFAAPLPSAASDMYPPPLINVNGNTDEVCGGRVIVETQGKRYLLSPTVNGALQIHDTDQLLDPKPCPIGAPDAAHTAPRYVAWDRETNGCVNVTRIDGRTWILSSGWGLIPGDQRIDPNSNGCMGRLPDNAADIPIGEVIHLTPVPVVPVIEDRQGYMIDSRVACTEAGEPAYARFVPALGQCISTAVFKVRGDLAAPR